MMKRISLTWIVAAVALAVLQTDASAQMRERNRDRARDKQHLQDEAGALPSGKVFGHDSEMLGFGHGSGPHGARLDCPEQRQRESSDDIPKPTSTATASCPKRSSRLSTEPAS